MWTFSQILGLNWDEQPRNWGPKIRNLIWLLQHGFSENIPPFIIINATEVQKIHEIQTIPENLRQNIHSALKELGGETFFVRSAAFIEDEIDQPTAGLFYSQGNVFLHVLENSILRCVENAYSSKIKTILGKFPSFYVVIQAQIFAKKSGILFSKNPLTDDPSVIIIEAGFGLGEGVVSGKYPTDHYEVEKSKINETLITKVAEILRSREIAHKTFFINPEDGKETPLEQKLIQKAVLSDEEILRLSKLSIQIEKHFGRSIDIEWALDSQQKLWLLQLRDAQ